MVPVGRNVPDRLTEAEAEAEKLPVGATLCVADQEWEKVAVPEGDPEGVGEAEGGEGLVVAERDRLVEGGWLRVGVGVPLNDGVQEEAVGEGEGEAVARGVAEGLREPVGVREKDGEADGDGVGEREPEKVCGGVGEELAVGVGEGDGEHGHCQTARAYNLRVACGSISLGWLWNEKSTHQAPYHRLSEAHYYFTRLPNAHENWV